MKQKFISIKKLIMPVMQALILVSSLSGCALKQQEFAELMSEADNLSVELAVGTLDKTGQTVTVYMPSFGINNLKNSDDNAAATQFKDAFGKLKPATTLMGVMTGNNGDARYFMVPGATANNSSSSEFTSANAAAESLYTHISPDVFKKTPALESTVKAAIASSIYYNTWSSTFSENSGNSNSVASGYVETSISKTNMIIGVFNQIFGSDNIPGDEQLYGDATADMISEFESRLSGAADAARDTGTKQGEALANSIDAFLDSSDAENSIRKLMYMERYTDVDYVQNTVTAPQELSGLADSTPESAQAAASAETINSAQVLFENANKIDAIEVIYNIVREYDSDFNAELKDKDYEAVTCDDVSNTDFKDLDGSALQVMNTSDVFKAATTKESGDTVQTSRSQESVAREYQGVISNNSKSDAVLTAGQWEMYNDAAANTSILTNINQNNTKDLSLVSDMQVTDLYLMLLGASQNIDNGYNTGLETTVITQNTTEDSGQGDDDISYNYMFNVYVATYIEEQGVSEDELRNNQDTRYAMYEDIYSSGYDHVDAAKEKEDGCTNEFIDEFMQYSLDRNLEKIPDPNEAATPDSSESTGEKYEVSPGVYNDGTTRKLTTEEWESMTREEQDAWDAANNKELGGQSWDDLGHITEEEAQEAIDSFNPDNPYIQDIIDSGVLNN